MLYTIPDYYKEFKCVADQCEDTCCAGWQIVIDDHTLLKYRKIKGKFKFKMLSSVNWLTKTFRQNQEKRCVFLNEQNLCELYLQLGEGAFCKTCRLYPRHIEEFEGVREITLSLSCPEVARMIMERITPVTFICYEKEGEEAYEEFDPFLFSMLQDARTEMIKLLQNRNIPISYRVLLILGMAHDMQGRINRQELFSCTQVIDKYTQINAVKTAKEYYEKKECSEKAIVLIPKLFRKLYKLELLRNDWRILLDETYALLYMKNKKVYEEIKKEYKDWKEGCSAVTIHIEQLLVYFLFTYFPGAVYDGEVYSKVQMAVYCVWIIEELWMARWLRNGKELELEEMTELVYRFSREVEHSDQNLKLLEKMMRNKWK